MTVLLIAGTRPEVIKLAPVYRRLQFGGIDAKWLFTGQQDDLAAEAFEAFGMEPEMVMPLNRRSGELPELFWKLGKGVAGILRNKGPRLVLVQGDTLSAAVGAQQAFLAKIPVGHVEAGLRSFDVRSPFPEEAARIWIDAVAALKFAPTRMAAKNLPPGNVWVTGNTGIDAVTLIEPGPERKENLTVVTLHRRENAGAVGEVVRAVRRLTREGVLPKVVWIKHPNPMVAETVPRLLGNAKNVEFVDPLPYAAMINLVRNSDLLLTDSGGLQEEALALGIPCLVLRKETERPEGIRTGGAKLVGCDEGKIYGWARYLMENPDEWIQMARARNPYGDGKASIRIAHICKHWLMEEPLPDEMYGWDDSWLEEGMDVQGPVDLR